MTKPNATNSSPPAYESASSVGIVTPEVVHFDEPITLANGRILNEYQLVVETYGKLNEKASNAILICHALSGNHHAAGYHSPEDKRPGWWDAYIGPGKPIDTNKFFVVAVNNIGGCSGSTGPTSINPETGKAWGPTFPICAFATGYTHRHAWLTNWAFKPGQRLSVGALAACKPCVGHWNTPIE